jgi:6-phosphogluconolactonase/Glucosamine-6-phosphate isomerase/deaminase
MTSTYPSYRTVDRLVVETHPDRSAMGRAAARAAAACIRDAISTRGRARVIFGCAPSQDDLFASLVEPARCGATIQWKKVTAFHMDDYVGLSGDHPQSFRRYLSKHLLEHVPVGTFHPLRAEADDIDAVCAEYARLLAAEPIDLICLGIGENGHIAFNDPPVAEFDDPVLVKRVEIDQACRQQQVNDGCFDRIDDVPRHALTLTVPVFRHARRLSVHVPGHRKAAAVAAALQGPIAPACPASILRLHPHATLYLDPAAASALS